MIWAGRWRPAPGPGWVAASVQAGRGRTLTVHHRAGDDRWVELARAYWGGRLAGLEPVASSRFSVIHRGRVPPDGRLCFFKRFLVRGWRDWIKHQVRPSRARRALVRGEQIAALGFATARPLCLIEERRPGGGAGPSGLVTEAIEQAPSLQAWITRPGDERRRMLHALGRAIGAWHAAGLYHGDMTPYNILCRPSPAGWEVFWLDNEGSRLVPGLPMRLRVRNLVQVNKRLAGLSRTDRLRLARGYLDAVGLSPDLARELLRRVARATERRLRAQRRRTVS